MALTTSQIQYDGCRWSEHIPAWMKRADLLWDNSTADYQGNVEIIVKTPDNMYHYLEYSYGSCSGCDAWEDRPEAEVAKEIESLILSMTKEEFIEWKKRLKEEDGNYDETIEQVI